jgi:hypothetical protein
MRTPLLTAVLLLPCAPIAAAQQPGAVSAAAAPFAWAAERLVPASFTYRITSEGNTLDSAHIRFERLAGAARPTIRISSALGDLSQSPNLDTLTLDGVTLVPVRVWTRGSAARSVDLTYRDTHVTGHVHFPYNGTVTDRDIDTVLAAGTLVDEQVLWSLAALPLAAGGSWQVPAYSWTGAGAMTISATVTADTSVTVPAGTFPCWKIQLSAATFAFTVYVTKAAPYLMARYEWTGASFAIELVQRTP